MDLSKGNRNRIANSKANNMAFDILILLVLVVHSKQTMNKPIVPRRSNNIIV